MSELKKVNLFAGRFQPFHAGHLQCCSDAFKENGYPTVIMYIHNEKFDEKKPFDDSVIEKELEIVKKNCDFIARIPMYGKINSLNASVATGIIVYEAVRCRNDL